MEKIDIKVREIEQKFPDYLSSKDIEDLGLITQQSLHKLRILGNGPPFLRLPGARIKYATDTFIKWFKRHYYDSSDKSNSRLEMIHDV
ncbi:MAG: hypothetical protein JSR46_06290 [Verrucomicrobia bacterium]|nr:hypothetical protein [Verrucomicrobiota bacterium]